MSWHASRQIQLRSWDAMVIPLPFSKAVMRIGPPIDLKEIDGGLREKIAFVQNRLKAFEEETDPSSFPSSRT